MRALFHEKENVAIRTILWWCNAVGGSISYGNDIRFDVTLFRYIRLFETVVKVTLWLLPASALNFLANLLDLCFSNFWANLTKSFMAQAQLLSTFQQFVLTISDLRIFCPMINEGCQNANSDVTALFSSWHLLRWLSAFPKENWCLDNFEKGDSRPPSLTKTSTLFWHFPIDEKWPKEERKN